MAGQQPNQPTPSFPLLEKAGVIRKSWLHLRLALSLILDKRVKFLHKLVPLGGLLYVISPVDIVPEALTTLLGPLGLAGGLIDDVVIFGLALTWFFHLCPSEVVKEYTNYWPKQRRTGDESKDDV